VLCALFVPVCIAWYMCSGFLCCFVHTIL
jgi:hypothetical protein